MNYETMKEAGYTHLAHDTVGGHLLRNDHLGKLEFFVTRKSYAGWAIKYKNTHLEFCRTATAQDIINCHKKG